MDVKLMGTMRRIGRHLDQIKVMFKPGFKVCVVVWHPTEPDLDVIMIDPGSSYDDAIEVIARRRDDPESLTGRI